MAAINTAQARPKQIQPDPVAKVPGQRTPPSGAPKGAVWTGPHNPSGGAGTFKGIGGGWWAPKAPMPKAPKVTGPTKSSFNPLTSSFGLNLKSKAPYSAFSAPTTQGAFNKQVLGIAQPQYLPQLQDIAGQQAAENAATKERTGDIGSIYNQYQSQAQSAYNEVQKSLQDIIAQNAPAQGQANLSAALQSAQGGQNQLGQMMGMATPTGPATLPYTGAANAATAATRDELNSLASSFLGVPAEQLGNAPLERATELNTEDLRHEAAAQGLRTQRSALVQQIPGIIATARQQLIADLQSGQSLQFQERLAGQQFGLSKQAQNFNESLQTKQFKETAKNDATNRWVATQGVIQNNQALKNQTAATTSATQQAIDKATGQAQANAAKYLGGALTPGKNDFKTVTLRNPQTQQVIGHQTVLKDPNNWHPDLGTLLRTVMDQYGLSEGTALRMIADIGGRTPIRGTGGQTIADWALTFQRRASGRGVKNIGQGIARSIPKATIPRRIF